MSVRRPLWNASGGWHADHRASSDWSAARSAGGSATLRAEPPRLLGESATLDVRDRHATIANAQMKSPVETDLCGSVNFNGATRWLIGYRSNPPQSSNGRRWCLQFRPSRNRFANLAGDSAGVSKAGATMVIDSPPCGGRHPPHVTAPRSITAHGHFLSGLKRQPSDTNRCLQRGAVQTEKCTQEVLCSRK